MAIGAGPQQLGAVSPATLALAGLVCVLSTSPGSGRRFAKFFSRRQARYGALAGVNVLVVPRHPRRDQLHRQDAEQALGPHGEQAVQPLGPDAATCCRSSTRRSRSKCSRRSRDFPRYQDRLKEYEYLVEEGLDRVHRSRTRSASVAQQNNVQQYGTIVFNYKGRSERVTVGQRAGHHQRHHQGGVGPAAQGLLHAGPRRKGHRLVRTRRLRRHRQGARRRELRASRSSSSRSRDRFPTMRRSSSSPGRRPTSSSRRSTR